MVATLAKDPPKINPPLCNIRHFVNPQFYINVNCKIMMQ